MNPHKKPRLLPQGWQIVCHDGAPTLLGDCNKFNFITGEITLTVEIWNSRSPAAILVAAHELGHSRQPLWIHLLRFLPPVRWWQEMDAWRFAAEFLASACLIQQNEDRE